MLDVFDRSQSNLTDDQTKSVMSFFHRFQKKVPSTADGRATVATKSHSDPENVNIAEHTGVSNGFQTIAVQITPRMEKELVKKLDRRLVPLVMGLCMII